MSVPALSQLVLGVLLVGWIASRQLAWRPLDPRRSWTMPIVLAGAGLVVLASSAPAAVRPVDLGFLALELAVSVAIGAVMGAIAVFRDADRGLETRTGWLGLVLWIVLIAARVGLGFWGAAAGAELAESAGVILLVVGVNRVVRLLVVLGRARRRLEAVAA